MKVKITKKTKKVKKLLVELFKKDRFFIVWEMEDGSIITAQYIWVSGNSPLTICREFSNKDEFVENTRWHDWIVDGILNNKSNNYSKCKF